MIQHGHQPQFITYEYWPLNSDWSSVWVIFEPLGWIFWGRIWLVLISHLLVSPVSGPLLTISCEDCHMTYKGFLLDCQWNLQHILGLWVPYLIAFEMRACAMNTYVICADLRFLSLGLFLKCFYWYCYWNVKKFAFKYSFSFDSSKWMT